MKTIIEKVSAEVLRIIRESDCSQWGLGKMSACNRILNFLDTLQDQPVKIDIRKELASIEFMGVNDARDTETIARHFYELGRQSKEQPVRLPSQTKDEQEMQMARFLASKKETFFQLILANLIQNSAFVQMKEGINGDLSEFKAISVRAAIDAAIEGADYAITKLYPVEKKED